MENLLLTHINMNKIPTKTSLISIDLIIDQGMIKHNDFVCDLGCGRSLFFLYAISSLVGDKGKVYGVDVLPEIIDSAKKDIKHHKINNIEIVKKNIESEGSLKELYNKSQASFLINTLHQAENSLEMLKESFKTLKKGGFLVVCDWEDAPSPIGPDQKRRISKEMAKEAIEILSPKSIKEIKPGNYHYCLVVEK